METRSAGCGERGLVVEVVRVDSLHSPCSPKNDLLIRGSLKYRGRYFFLLSESLILNGLRIQNLLSPQLHRAGVGPPKWKSTRASMMQ